MRYDPAKTPRICTHATGEKLFKSVLQRCGYRSFFNAGAVFVLLFFFFLTPAFLLSGKLLWKSWKKSNFVDDFASFSTVAHFALSTYQTLGRSAFFAVRERKTC